MKRKFSYPILLVVLFIFLMGLLFINREVANASDDYNFKLGARELDYGSEGIDVLYLQIQLKVLGYYDGVIDGLFGRGTLRAIKQFQESRSIKPRGIIDTQTLKFLDSSNYVEQNNFEYQQVMTLARAINGEARGESFRGQVGVGAVILNRVQNSDFADSIREVIYQQGQFSAVSDGQVNLPPTKSSIQAAKAALLGYDPTGDALYFYNPEVATKLEWISSRPKIVKIDNHIFAD